MSTQSEMDYRCPAAGFSFQGWRPIALCKNRWQVWTPPVSFENPVDIEVRNWQDEGKGQAFPNTVCPIVDSH